MKIYMITNQSCQSGGNRRPGWALNSSCILHIFSWRSRLLLWKMICRRNKCFLIFAIREGKQNIFAATLYESSLWSFGSDNALLLFLNSWSSTRAHMCTCMIIKINENISFSRKIALSLWKIDFRICLTT